MRKIYILLVVLMLGVAGMAYLYFKNLNREGSASDISLQLVTAHAPVLFTFENDKSFYEILSGQQITDNLLGSTKSTLLSSVKDNVLGNNSIYNLLEGQKIVIGILPGNNHEVDFLIATQAKLGTLDKSILTQLKADVRENDNSYRIQFADSTVCYISMIKNSILLSNNPQILAKIGNKVLPENEFSTYIKQNSHVNKNTLANVYINYKQLPILLKNILNTNLNGELSIFNKQNSFASLSYNFGSDKLLLNGYTDIKDEQSYMALFIAQKEQKVNIDQFFPEQTANYAVFNVNDYEIWSKDLKNWQKAKNEDLEIVQQQKTINEKYRVDINQTFPKYFNKQLAVLQLKTGEKLGIIETKNGDKLGQLLLDLSTEYATDIRILKENNLLYHFFGEPFKKFERPFYTIIDNHFVVSNYASSIQVFLSSYRNNKLLVATENYIHFKDQTSNAATIAFYINHKNSNDIFGRNLRSTYYKQYKSEKGVRDYNAFGYQLSADNGRFMSNVLLLKNQTKKEIDSLQNNQ